MTRTESRGGRVKPKSREETEDEDDSTAIKLEAKR